MGRGPCGHPLNPALLENTLMFCRYESKGNDRRSKDFLLILKNHLVEADRARWRTEHLLSRWRNLYILLGSSFCLDYFEHSIFFNANISAPSHSDPVLGNVFLAGSVSHSVKFFGWSVGALCWSFSEITLCHPNTFSNCFKNWTEKLISTEMFQFPVGCVSNIP